MSIAWVKHAPGSERLPHVYACQSLNREAPNGHRRLYQTIMFGPSELTRAEQQAMAVTVADGLGVELEDHWGAAP